MIWRTYAYGYKTRDAAIDAMYDEISEGRLSAADCCVLAYTTHEGARRWQILELDPEWRE